MTGQQSNDFDLRSSDDAELHREFLGLFSAAAGRLYAYVSCLLTHADEADDAFQEVSYLLWSKFDQFDRQRDFLCWAKGIAHFVVLKQRQKAKRRLLMDDATLELVASAASDRVMQSGTQRQALTHCLEKLNPADRQVLRLRYELQMKPKEIGPHLGRSVHSVYRALARIHQALLACIHRTVREASN